MKKNFLRFIGTAFCSAILAGVLTYNAFAVENDISVKIDDKLVEFTDVKPVIENDRTFVPFRAIFEQMNADVSWNEDERRITAVRDDITVRFTIGKQEVSITENDETTTKVIDAAPFIQNSRTYVPIRFASEALGACVDWDSDTRTVLIVDVDKLMTEYENKFTNIDNYISLISSEKNTGLDGTFNLLMQYKTAMGNIPVSVQGTLTGNKNNVSTEISGTAFADTETIKSAIIQNEGENAINSEVESILSNISNTSYQAMINNADNKLYLSGSAFTAIGLEYGTWAAISLDSFGNNFVNIGSSDNFADYISNSAQSLVLNTNPNNTISTVKNYLDNAKKLYGDKSFTVSEDGIVSLSQSNGSNNYNLALKYDENNKLFDAVLTGTSVNNGITSKITLHETTSSCDFSLSMTGAKKLDINFTLSAQKSDSSKTPAYIPNGDVIDVKLN